ncbi:MAG: phosphotransferase [Dehalococcoidia bacterium]
MAQLPPLIQALLNEETYPEKPERVDLVQTQMSFVFLLGKLVYKIKKPVNFGFLDFSTLEKRHHYCQQEVMLNRRLNPEMYLGVVEISQNGDDFSMDGSGEIVEYAVKMQQIPLERTLDRLLARDEVTPEMLDRVAQKLVNFHQQSESTPEISKYGDVTAITRNTDENFSQTQQYIGRSLSQQTYNTIKTYTENFLRNEDQLFRHRVEEGRIKDCHGDLHSAHICFGEKVYIFDCIEFNDRFRYSDVASEIAFLAMDLDFHGHPDLGKHFVDAYVKASGDQELLQLLDFYKCYRAYVRGKVESFKLDDPHISDDEKQETLGIASRYFTLAESYASAYIDEKVR